MTFEQYRYLILSDLYREDGKTGYVHLLKELIIGVTFKYTFWMRTCTYLRQYRIFKYSLYIISILMYRHYTYKFGISIPTSSKIGPGLFITHFGGIVINKDSIIGKNCNISSGVFLDEINAGVNKGVPIIGDNVCIGPGVKIAGNVMVGNNVVIGANCVVTKDIEDNSKVLSGHNNTIENMDVDGCIGFTDYKNKILG